jgi:4-amino-4-deoxy-L-arabinose transferase-like glycosyltransferase
MHVLYGNGPRESAFYDHPYWGQLFLAGIFWLVGYPNSLHPLNDVHSIEMLYLFPRVLMGIFAVIDTFLVYKISEYKYRSVVFVASILFAVMPITWLTRRIFLGSIQLPFLLSSILFAIYSTKNYDDHNHSNKKANTTISKKVFLLILLSGVFLGLAIFTKIPAFTMIPLVGFLVLRNASNNKNKRLKILGLWLIPVLLFGLAINDYPIL